MCGEGIRTTKSQCKIFKRSQIQLINIQLKYSKRVFYMNIPLMLTNNYPGQKDKGKYSRWAFNINLHCTAKNFEDFMGENYPFVARINARRYMKYSKQTFVSTCCNLIMGSKVVFVTPVLWKTRYGGFLMTCLVLLACLGWQQLKCP